MAETILFSNKKAGVCRPFFVLCIDQVLLPGLAITGNNLYWCCGAAAKAPGASTSRPSKQSALATMPREQVWQRRLTAAGGAQTPLRARPRALPG